LCIVLEVKAAMAVGRAHRAIALSGGRIHSGN
jgi:hypothetical protein